MISPLCGEVFGIWVVSRFAALSPFAPRKAVLSRRDRRPTETLPEFAIQCSKTKCLTFLSPGQFVAAPRREDDGKPQVPAQNGKLPALRDLGGDNSGFSAAKCAC